MFNELTSLRCHVRFNHFGFPSFLYQIYFATSSNFRLHEKHFPRCNFIHILVTCPSFLLRSLFPLLVSLYCTRSCFYSFLQLHFYLFRLCISFVCRTIFFLFVFKFFLISSAFYVLFSGNG